MDYHPIGTQFMTRGKCPRLCTVVDLWITTNAAGKLMTYRYVATHRSATGQIVTDYDVVGVTVAMGLISTPAKEGTV